MLGAGGGGDPGLGLVMALRGVEQHGAVAVVEPDDIADDALVMPCGLVGSPTVANERMWNGTEPETLQATVEELHGAPVAALMMYAVGGANGLLPVAWAAQLGLPLLDADGTGRTFPEIQQQAMGLAGVEASPVVLTDGRGNTVVLRAAGDAWAERLARSAATSLGGVCAGALYAMSGEEARRATIRGSVTLAVGLGRAMEQADVAHRVRALGDALGAVVLIEGRVADLERHAGAGFTRGSATVQGGRDDAGRQLRLELQNEFLLALEDGAVRAAVPDVVCVLGADTGDPVPAEALRHGQRVVVLAWSCPEVWRSAAGLALAGPRAFGYDIDPGPIAEPAGDARR